MTTSRSTPLPPETRLGITVPGQALNLALATWTFAINFWAWNLIAPLSATYTKAMSLTSTQTALLVATPILVGSVGRIPVGALTDRYGGRRMFTVISLISIVPVLLVAFAGAIDSYVLLLIFGFFLGIAGTAFAVGIPFVNAWYETVPAWIRDRCVRCRHGRHRAVRVLHAPVRDLVRVRHGASHHRRGAWPAPRCWS